VRPSLRLVDDDPATMQVLARRLGRAGTLRFALSGAEALHLAQVDPPDLVLADAEIGPAWARARRQQEALSLALFDVDHFKAYNDPTATWRATTASVPWRSIVCRPLPGCGCSMRPRRWGRWSRSRLAWPPCTRQAWCQLKTPPSCCRPLTPPCTPPRPQAADARCSAAASPRLSSALGAGCSSAFLKLRLGAG
jgi:hypothetical protein